MKTELKSQPRTFQVGKNNQIKISDFGQLFLTPDEMLTFVTPSKKHFDVVQKDWGFYATPSINSRLAKEGFHTALVRNLAGQEYIMLVEKELKQEFYDYCDSDNQVILTWLYNEEPSPCMCSSPSFIDAVRYDTPPSGETNFQISKDKYHRTYKQCENCGHYRSHHDLDLTNLYDGEYVNSTYGDSMAATFKKIIQLPKEKSDNQGRVDFLRSFIKSKKFNCEVIKVLDVGSGLGVFPYLGKLSGWDMTALDPDPRAAKHIRDISGIATLNVDFLKSKLEKKFDLITFNKVLEHVENPKEFLTHARSNLRTEGIIYVEVPDGEEAFKNNGYSSEEFYIEHLHVFSLASLALLISRVGLNCVHISRIKEPSGKFTLRALANCE